MSDDATDSAETGNEFAPAEYAPLLDEVQTGVFVIDSAGTVVYANKHVCEMFDRQREDLLGTALSELFHSADTAEPTVTSRIERAAQGDEQIFECTTTASTETAVRATVAVGQTAVGGTGHLRVAVRDVTAGDQQDGLDRNQSLRAKTEMLTDSGGWELNCQTDELRWTAGTRRIHEVGPAYDPTLESALDFYHEDDQPVIESAIEQTIETGESFDETLRLVTDDDTQRWVIVHGDPIQENDETVLLRGAIQDVTEQKEHEQELQMKSKALDQVDVGMTITDATKPGKPLVYVNEAFLRMTGYSREEVLGYNGRLLRGPGTDPETAGKIEEAVENGTAATVDIKNYRKDGSMFWNRLRIRPFREESGTVTHFLDIQEDVTQRVELRNELKELTKRLELALRETNTGVWDWNLDTGDVFWDEASEELFDYDIGDFPGTYEGFADRVHPEDLHRVEQHIETAIDTGEGFRGDFRIQLPDGTTRWIQARGVIEDDEDGPTRMYGIQTDITSRKQYELELEDKNAKLELLNRIVRHDIRNDMDVILGFAPHIENEIADEQARERLQKMVESGEHVVELTEIVRDLMETMLGDGDVTKPVLLETTLKAELDSIRSMDEDVVVDGPDTYPTDPVRADEMLGTIFRNLLTNAVRHNNASEPELSVTVTESRTNVTVRIADNGPGVPDSQKDEIFGRGEKGLESPGTGVGLYLVDTLVSGYSGEIWVEDSDLGGAVFVVRLPKVEQQEGGVVTSFTS